MKIFSSSRYSNYFLRVHSAICKRKWRWFRPRFSPTPLFTNSCLGFKGNQRNSIKEIHWTKIHWTKNPMDKKFTGQKIHWTKNPMDKKSNGQKIQWTKNPMDKKSNGQNSIGISFYNLKNYFQFKKSQNSVYAFTGYDSIAICYF